MTRWRKLAGDRRVVDTVVVVACLALTALAVKTPWSTLPRPVIAVAGVLGSAAQWHRLCWPHLATTAGAVTYALSGNPGPLLVGLYSGVAHGSRGQAWALGLVGWTGFAVWSWLDVGRLTVTNVVYAAAAAGVVVGIGRYTATRNALLASLRERAQHAEAERLLRVEQARAAERTRIAGEMHDVVAHKVSLIALYAGALELHAGGNTRFQEGTALIRSTAREALRELRSVLGMLRAEPEPFVDLASLVQASAQAGQPVELHDEAGPLPPATARVVYRVVQEGLTNAHKHAPAARTTVSLRRAGRSVSVNVLNEAGVPMDLPGSGAGLVGLAERLRLVGGSLRSGPTSGGGWELHATVPCIGDEAQ
jgi:signal transduction histidine kinase